MYKGQKKTFTEPACMVEQFTIEDIITTSSEGIPTPDNWDTDEF